MFSQKAAPEPVVEEWAKNSMNGHICQKIVLNFGLQSHASKLHHRVGHFLEIREKSQNIVLRGG